MNTDTKTLAETFLKWTEGMVPKLLAAILVLLVGMWLSKFLSKLLRKALERSKTDGGIVTFLGSLLKASLEIVVIVTAISALGVQISSALIAAVGAAGLTVGLALKDSMTNIASGVQIVFTKPFLVGDYLAIDGVEGTVERIEMMFTVLRTVDNKEIILPNSKIIVSTLVNFSAKQTRRLDLEYTVSGREDFAKVKNLLLEIAEKNAFILKQPEPQVLAGTYKGSSMSVQMLLWCKKEDYVALQASMQEKVKAAFEENQIQLPTVQMDVHITE